MASNLILFLIQTLLFPAAAGLALTSMTLYFSNQAERGEVRTPRQVHSDLMNEFLNADIEKYSKWIFFALYFNIAYLTANVAIGYVNQVFWIVIYVAAIASFLIALFFIFIFHLRFHVRRYVAIGLVFAVAGTIVIISAFQFGFAKATATGTVVSGNAAGALGNVAVPLALAGVAWCLAVIAFLIEGRQPGVGYPLRVPDAKAYQLFLCALIVGWVGVCLAMLHSLSPFL